MGRWSTEAERWRWPKLKFSTPRARRSRWRAGRPSSGTIRPGGPGSPRHRTPTSSPAAYSRRVIDIRGLHKSFGDRALFRDASVRIGARDRLALVGPNGSGKTTLVEMIGA